MQHKILSGETVVTACTYTATQGTRTHEYTDYIQTYNKHIDYA